MQATVFVRSTLVFSVCFLFAGTLPSQTTWPQWASDITSGHYANHPALQSIAAHHRKPIPNARRTIIHGDYMLYYHAGYGDIAIKQIHPHGSNPATTRLGTIATGLSYIMWLQSVVSVTASGSVVLHGVSATGIRPDGRPEVVYAPWTASTAIGNVCFSSLVLGTGNEVFLNSGIIGAELYVFEAALEEVRRFVDADGDGLPDAADGLTPASIAQAAPQRTVWGFNEAPNGGVGVQLTPGVGLLFHTIDVGPTALTISQHLMADYVEIKPHIGMIGGGGLVEGLKKLWCWYSRGWKISAEWKKNGTWTAMSAAHEITDPFDRWVAVPLFRAVEEADEVRIIATGPAGETVYSETYTVQAKSIFLHAVVPADRTSGDSIVLEGENFQSSTTLVTVTIDGMTSANHGYTILSSSSMAVDAVAVAEGATAAKRVVVTVSDSRFQDVKLSAAVYVVAKNE